MAINKVIYGTSTLIDLTADTVATDTLGKDTTAHDKSGAEIIGTLESGGSTGGGSETWVLNTELTVPTEVLIDGDNKEWTSQFVSNNNVFTSISLRIEDGDINYIVIYYGLICVGVINHTQDLEIEDPGWVNYDNEAYRKITFSTPPTGDLLTWLQANGRKSTAKSIVDWYNPD